MEKIVQSFYPVRFPDCDPFGHLNNSRYLDYFLNAREDHLKHHYQFPLAEYYKNGIAWVVSGHQIQFLKPALYDETVCIQTSLIDASESHLLVEALMWDASVSTCKAIAWSRFTPVDLTTGARTKHLPEFSPFIDSVLRSDVDVALGLQSRTKTLLSNTAKAKPSI